MTDDEIKKINEERVEKLIFAANAISEKYVYYILAVDAACVAFGINQSKDLRLSYYQIPLGFAMIFWCLSFYFGMTQLSKFERLTNLNILKLRFVLFKLNFPQKEDNELNGIGEKVKLYRKRQNVFFAVGALFFMSWHILKMTKNC